MQQIQFANVAESFDRVIQEVLAQFLGQVKTIGQVPVAFAASEIGFNFRLFDNTDASQLILFIGEGAGDAKKYKVPDPNNTRPFGYEARMNVERKIFIRTKFGQDVNAAERSAKQLWSQLHGIFLARIADFSHRGVYYPDMEATPNFYRDQFAYFHWGFLGCELRCQYTQDDLGEGL